MVNVSNEPKSEPKSQTTITEVEALVQIIKHFVEENFFFLPELFLSCSTGVLMPHQKLLFLIAFTIDF